MFSASASGGFRANASATKWTLGNGHVAVGVRASATYATAGEYLAIASLSDAAFGNASEAFVIDAEPAGPPGVGITGTVTPAVNVSSGTTVRWNATVLGPPAQLAGSQLVWEFGNGGGALGTQANETFVAPEDLPAHDLLSAGVAVDAADGAPLVAASIPLRPFFAEEAAGFVPAVDALVATAAVTPEAGLLPLGVGAVANASGPGGVSVSWQFGDGGTGSGLSVDHIYYAAGRYTLALQAKDGFDDAAVRLAAIEVHAALDVTGCGASDRQGNAPFTVRLAPTVTGGTGPPYVYRWTLPGGSLSSSANVTLSFGSAGTYVVVLVVSDPTNGTFGCAWSFSITAVPPLTFVDIFGGSVVAGLVLAVVFVAATRPRRPR